MEIILVRLLKAAACEGLWIQISDGLRVGGTVGRLFQKLCELRRE